MKREEALNLLRKIEAFRQQPAMHKAEHDFTCRIIAAMVAEAGGFKSRNEWTAEIPEGASVYVDDAGCPVIDYDGFKQGDVINQYDGNGCRPYIIDSDRRRAYLEVVEL